MLSVPFGKAESGGGGQRKRGLNGNVTFTLVKSLVETLVNALKKGPLLEGSESKSPAALLLRYLVPG